MNEPSEAARKLATEWLSIHDGMCVRTLMAEAEGHLAEALEAAAAKRDKEWSDSLGVEDTTPAKLQLGPEVERIQRKAAAEAIERAAALVRAERWDIYGLADKILALKRGGAR